MLNVRVHGDAKAILGADAVRAALAEAERALDGRGRVFLRASGTEPLIRVTVEAEDADQVRDMARTLAEVVESATERS
jgi:phosphoglucosamine mutase